MIASLFRFIALIAFAALGSSLGAQFTRPRLIITLPAPDARSTEAPTVSCENILSDGSIQDQIRNSLPARLHFRLERWSFPGMFNKLEKWVEWDMIVRYDALSKRYEVYLRDGSRPMRYGPFSDFASVEEVLQHGHRPGIVPPKAGVRTYYQATLVVETMSVSDLDELERWMKGELTPAVRGKRNPGTAIGRGIKTFLLRLMGAQQRRYQISSDTFE